MFGKAMLGAVAASFCAAALLADPPAPPAAANAHQRDPNRRVCRRVEDAMWRTGSGSVCKTQADWDRIARQNDDDYRTAMRSGGTGFREEPLNDRTLGRDGLPASPQLR